MQSLILYTDGGCLGNNQPDASKRIMVAAVTDQSGTVVVEKRIPGGTNNVAEMIAVREALEWAQENGYADVEIRTDSRNNFAWVLGKIGDSVANREVVSALRKRIDTLRQNVIFKLVWVPRSSNLAGRYLESSL